MPFVPQERAMALAEGRSMYFTGRPCKKGHVCKRITSNGACVECAAIAAKVKREKDPEAANKKYAISYLRHRDKKVARAARYRAENPEKVAEAGRRWRKNNKEKRCALQVARHAKKIQAMPKWLDPQQIKDIETVYTEAQKMREQFGAPIHVDHIVPLAGVNVCGLHVPWNLQLVAQSYNSSKGNRFCDMPETIAKSGHVLVHSSALPWNLQEKT